MLVLKLWRRLCEMFYVDGLCRDSDKLYLNFMGIKKKEIIVKY